MWDALGTLGAWALFAVVVILLIAGLVKFAAWFEGYAARRGITIPDDDDDDGPLDTWWQAPPPTFRP